MQGGGIGKAVLVDPEMGVMGGEGTFPSAVAKAEIAVAARPALHEIAHVLGPHLRNGANAGVFLAHQLDHGGIGQPAHAVFIDHAGIALHDVHLRPAAHGSGDALRRLAHQRAQLLPQLWAEGAEDAAQAGCLRDDIAAGARMEAAHGDHGGFRGAHPAGDQALQGADDLAADEHRVDAQGGGGPVGAPAVNGDGKGIGGRIFLPELQAELACGVVHGAVSAKDRIHMGLLQTALRHHPLGSAVIFLVGLEQKLDIAPQRPPCLLQQPCRAQQRRRVGIVAAGVHHAGIFRGKGQARLLLQGQGVHIRPQGDGPAGRAAADQANNAGPGAFSRFDAHALQLPQHQRLRPVFLPAQLRVLVERAAQLDQIGGNLLRPAQDLLGSDHKKALRIVKDSLIISCFLPEGKRGKRRKAGGENPWLPQREPPQGLAPLCKGSWQGHRP